MFHMLLDLRVLLSWSLGVAVLLLGPLPLLRAEASAPCMPLPRDELDGVPNDAAPADACVRVLSDRRGPSTRGDQAPEGPRERAGAWTESAPWPSRRLTCVTAAGVDLQAGIRAAEPDPDC